jgi:3-oxoadipate enol-lactonase
MYIATDDGARIHVETAPDNGKPPLVFSNSLGTNLHMWDAQMPAFGEHFRVIRYDSRGHGRSDPPKGPYSIERLGRDALAVFDGLGIKRAYFCGLSKGGMVGQWLGANASDRIERLVVSNTAAYIPAPDLWNQRIEIATNKGMGALAKGIIERWFTPEVRANDPGEVGRVNAMLLATPSLGYAACCFAIRDMDQREAIKGVTVPTLVVIGERDPATPPDRGQEIHQLIKGSKLALLDAAHLSNIEKTDAFNRAVLGFLTQ